MKRLLSILALGFLTACGHSSTAERIVIETRVEPVGPPDALLVIPSDPFREVTTTGGVVDQLNAYKGAFGSCVASIEAIAEWKRSIVPPVPPARPGPDEQVPQEP